MPRFHPDDEVENALKYSAVGDGQADDTGDLKRMIAAAALNKRSYIPAGTYLVSSPITLSARSLYGEHFWRATEGGTIIKAAPNFSGEAVIIGNNNQLQLKDLIIDASDATVDYAVKITSGNGPTTRLENVTTIGGDVAGLYLYKSQFASVSNCIASSSGGHGFLIKGCNSTSFTECRALTSTGDGFRIEDETSFSGGCIIEGGGSEDNGGNGYSVIGTSAETLISLGRIRDVWCEGNAGDAFYAKWAEFWIFQSSRLLPPPSFSAQRAVRLVESIACTVRDNLLVAGGDADYVQIREEDRQVASTFDNNWVQSSNVAPTTENITS